MTERDDLIKEQLVKLIGSTEYGIGSFVGRNFQAAFIERIANRLIANGVTVASDTDVGLKWIPVAERLPDEYVPVLGHMTDTDGFSPVRECFLIDNEFWFPALLTTWPVDRWAELPEG